MSLSPGIYDAHTYTLTQQHTREARVSLYLKLHNLRANYEKKSKSQELKTG